MARARLAPFPAALFLAKCERAPVTKQQIPGPARIAEHRQSIEGEKTPTCSGLFHGTTLAAASAIVKDGFRLPPPVSGPSTQIVVTVPEGAVAGHSMIVNSPNGGKLRVNIPAGVVAGQKMRVWQAGMFGRGIYFAGCPLKSLQYSRSTPRQNLAPWAPLLASRGGADGTADAPQLMLLCDVELGQPLYERTRPRPYLDRASLVRARTQHARDMEYARDILHVNMRDAGLSTGFDSLVATTVVRVPEYVVYTPEQSAPRYVLEVRELPR